MEEADSAPHPPSNTHRIASNKASPVFQTTPPVDEERAEDAFDLPLGSIVHSAENGRKWVFVGWCRNSAGCYPYFVEARYPDRFAAEPIYDYHASAASTLERKFPDIVQYRRKRG